MTPSWRWGLLPLLLLGCSDGAPGGAGGAQGSGGAETTGAEGQGGGATGGGGDRPAGCTPFLVPEEDTAACSWARCDQLHFGPDGGPDWCSGLCGSDEHCFGEATCYFDQTFQMGSCALPCDGGACEAPLVCADGRCVMNP